ncbi:gag/pol protein [Cucumis melo var. makuwa]|uniref:Gag/pol protein n=2 Tax=Cucumis melo TaxID=3656 RepID=A0A5D3DIF8_CUCMM|nr:gag/pol protein [Cucumis melo var. makuwa]
MNSSIVQLLASEKLNDDNYAAWKSNLNTILVVDDLRFFLTEECPQTPASNTNRARLEAYDRWIKANEKARVYILASMSDVLAKKHESLATPKEIMDSLKGMFGQPEWFLRHEAIKYIYTKRMKEGTFVREHVPDMMMHFNIAEINRGAIDEANQVSFILESLLKSFIPFQTNASLNKIEFNLTILLNELQLFQNLTKGKGKEVEANVATIKGKFRKGSFSKSKVGHSKSNKKIEKKEKGKTPKQNKGKKTEKKWTNTELGSSTSGVRLKKTGERKPRTQFSRPEARTSRNSTHTPGMLLDMFCQGIGRDASSLQRELRCDPKRSKRWPMLRMRGERSYGVRNHWKSTCNERNRLSSRTFDVRHKITQARTPRTSTHTPGMLPNTFSQGIGREASLLEGELSKRNRLSSRNSGVRPKKMDSVFSSWSKTWSQTVSSLYFLLVISLLIFGAHTPRTSTHTLDMLPDMFSQGIGREASSLEGELRCDPKWYKRWPMLQTSGELSSGVRNNWKRTCSERNRLGSRTSNVCPKKTLARMPQTQFPRPRTLTHTPGMLPDTFSQGIGREASSLEGELKCNRKRSNRWPMLPTSGEHSSGRKASSLEGELRYDPKWSKRWPMLPTSGERSSGVRNHWKCTCSEGNMLSSRTFGNLPKKTGARKPQIQFSHAGVKSGHPTVSSLLLRIICLLMFGAPNPTNSTHTPDMLSHTLSYGIGREASSLEEELWCDPKRSKSWLMLQTSGGRSSDVRNHWKCTCNERNKLMSRTSGVRPRKTQARIPHT